MMAGQTPPPRAFGADLTGGLNTPPRPERGGLPPAVASAVAVQRYALRSRRAPQASHPYARPLALEEVRPHTIRLTQSMAGELHLCGQVTLCECTWKKALIVHPSRLCQRDTEEHPEFKLLEGMGKRFREEVGDRLAEASMARKATMQQLEVDFIKIAVADGRPDTVAGYVAVGPPIQLQAALTKGAPSYSGEAKVLTQLYVDPGFRRRGYATSALRCLLAHSQCLLLRAEVAQWPGAVAAVRSLTRLGFQQAAGCDLPGYILYQRPQNVHSGENMQDVL